jgi:uncharacterized protein YodC (DUF2158 family)
MKVGDVVRLKSDSVRMVVYNADSKSCWCWYRDNEGIIHSASFNKDVLDLIPTDHPYRDTNEY